MTNETFFGQMFAFANRPMPQQPTGPYQTTGTLLRVLGWIALVYLGLMLVGMLIGFFAVVLFGAVAGALPGPWEWVRELGGALAAIAAIAILFAMLFMLAVGGALLFWIGWTYARWTERDGRALTQLLVLGVVMTVLGGLSLLGNSISGFGQVHLGSMFDSLGALVMLGFGITFLVMHNNQDVKAAFRPSPVQPGSDVDPA